MIQSILGRVAAGENLSMEESATAIDLIMQGQFRDEQIALLLTALRAKGETAEEIAGAARAMRRHMVPIRSRHERLLDTCGPGGTQSKTFNISTTAAIVAAAAGVPVAKHGNRGVTSRSGSADVLAALGVNVEATTEQVQRCLDELGLCFCYAPLLHPAMKRVAAVRKQLGVRTLFNLLGPLSNPAGANYHLLGVGVAELRPLLAETLAKLGLKRALVATGEDGLADVTIGGSTHVTLVVDGRMSEQTWTPADFGLSVAPLDALEVSNVQESAALIRKILAGAAGPPRDVVVLNAAAALYVAEESDDLKQCAARAAEAIDSGAAGQMLEELAHMSNLE